MPQFMRPQPNTSATYNTFTAYGDDYVCINTVRHTQNIIVIPDRLIPDWTAALDAEIILFGTGKELRFPPQELMQPLALVRKGLDVMNIHAACRAYNLLASEGRPVAAVLLFD
jgi:uncharacterized protein